MGTAMKRRALTLNHQSRSDQRAASAGGGPSGVPPAHKYLSVRAVAEHFGVDPSTVRRWIQKGCPCISLGSVGRGRGSRLDLEAVSRWRVSQLVPTVAHRREDDVLLVIETALLDSLKYDDLANRIKCSESQSALAVMIIFERCYRNVKHEALEPRHIPEQMKHLCAINLGSVERGTFQRRSP